MLTLEEFAGTPRIVKRIDVRPPPAPPRKGGEQFMGTFIAVYGETSFVYDGDVCIAVFERGTPDKNSLLWVDPNERDQGIATELVYEAMKRLGGSTPSKYRTADGQAIYAKVWERLK